MRAQQPQKKTVRKNEEKHKSRAGQVAVTFSLFLSFVYIGGRTGLDWDGVDRAVGGALAGRGGGALRWERGVRTSQWSKTWCYGGRCLPRTATPNDVATPSGDRAHPGGAQGRRGPTPPSLRPDLDLGKRGIATPPEILLFHMIRGGPFPPFVGSTSLLLIF